MTAWIEELERLREWRHCPLSPSEALHVLRNALPRLLAAARLAEAYLNCDEPGDPRDQWDDVRHAAAAYREFVKAETAEALGAWTCGNCGKSYTGNVACPCGIDPCGIDPARRLHAVKASTPRPDGREGGE